jgi:hypothetical protein
MTSRALLIGITYKKYPKYELKAPYNDLELMRNFLIDYYGFDNRNITALTDKIRDSLFNATFFNIVANLKKVINMSEADDFLVLYFSGHGGQIKDKDMDEIDGKDEVFLPSNFTESAPVNDDLINDLLKDCKCPVLMLFDCCHSGTLADLRYSFPVSQKKYIVDLNDDRVNPLKEKKIVSISSCLDSEKSVERWYPKKRQNLSVFTQHFIRMVKDIRLNGEFQITYEKLKDRMFESEVLRHGVISFSNSTLQDTNIFSNQDDEETRKYNETKLKQDVLLKENRELKDKNKRLERKNDKLSDALNKYTKTYGGIKNNFTNLLHKLN